MSQNLNSVPPFDGTNYGYWKARMRFFLKSIDVWKIVEIGWIKPEKADEIIVTQTSARLSNDKALHALCQALSLMKSNKFKNKFSNRLRKVPYTIDTEEAEKKDPRGPQCFEC
jgi:hypothetical protein